MSSTQTSKKSESARPIRGLAPHYSSTSVFDKKGQSHLLSLSVASCNQSRSGALNQDELLSSNSFSSRETAMENDRSKPFELSPPCGTATTQDPTRIQKLSVSDVMNCNCCEVSFENRDEQLSHYKCDWHRYNLHLRLRSQKGISEEDFEKLAATSDVSSISGSDESEEDEKEAAERLSLLKLQQDHVTEPVAENEVHEERKFHKIFFRNHSGELVSLYRCLLHHKKSPITNADELVSIATQLPKKTKWIVIMVSAGHFAGAVFNNNEVLEHKTFHRYTVRAKRGTAQSTRDGQGKFAKSAGARLRRYNEAALGQEVSDLLTSWASHVSTCDFIFVRIPVNNRGMFYGGKSPILKKDDTRIRVIPFPTRRPTFNEVKRVHQMLASVECYGQESEIGDIIPYSPPRVYVPETGTLQIREPRPEKKPKHFAQDILSEPKKEKDALTIAPLSQETGTSEEEAVDMDLVEVTQTVDFSHLKEFERRTPSPKKNKKKKKEVVERTSDGQEMDEERLRWQNKLFTACKSGNVETLNCLIEEIQNSASPLQCIPQSKTTESADSTIIMKCEETSNPAIKESSLSSLEKSLATCSTNNTTLQNERICSLEDASILNSAQSTSTTSEATIELSKGSNVENNMSGGVGENQSSNLLSEVLNKPVGDQGSTFLHVAAKQNQPDIIWILLETGTDPAIKDKCGKTAYNLGDTEVRNTFRRFMASFPEKYNYAKAQVPSPLTAEMEAEKKQKNAEKRKQKKKALNERNKEKKALEAKEREENREKQRFISLSEREKRALAAERRLLQQQSEQTGAKPVLSRCWQCGTDITGKVPFEYADYKFCTTKCLREHRTAASAKS